MPKLDGFGLLQALRANPETKNIPLIFLSARAGEEARVEGIQAGADDYLVKPFSAKELIARVEANIKLAHLRRRERLKPTCAICLCRHLAIICVLRGPQHIYELANAMYLQLFGI